MAESVLDRALAAAAGAAREVLEAEGIGAAVFLLTASSPDTDPNVANLAAAFGGIGGQVTGAVLAQLGAIAADAAIDNARELGVTIVEFPAPPSNN
jgi:hypothetical protein